MQSPVAEAHTHYDIGIHQTPLVTAWFILSNCTLLIAAFSWYKFSFYIHTFLGLTVIGLTLLGTIHVLFEGGFYFEEFRFQKLHNYIGLIVVIWCAIQLITGILARIIQYSPNVGTNFCIWTKRIHHISSYLIIALGKLNYLLIFYRRGKFLKISGMLLVDLSFVLFYLYIRFKYERLTQQIVQSQIIDKRDNQSNQNCVKSFINGIKSFFTDIIGKISQTTYNLPKIKYNPVIFQSQRQIPVPKYVIFNDYVYNIEPFEELHPGGQKVISIVQGRQVDRFLYGYYPPELTPKIIIHKHSKQSLRLLGQPIARIERLSPMKGLTNLCKIKMRQCQKISKNSSVHLVYLSPSTNVSEEWIQLKFQGFTQEKQIGQYFSLTVCNETGNNRNTRLYTSVWCMRPQNIQFMEKYFPGSTKNVQKLLQTVNETQKSLIQSNISIVSEELIPLLIKRYSDGQVTPRFLGLNNQFKGQMILSQPMGAGMKYDYLPQNGKVIILCGGTGILPFYDFIDLLWKRVKFLQNTNLSGVLATNNRLVRQDLIKDRQFYLYISSDLTEDLSAMILYQINYLSQSRLIRLKSVLRTKQSSNELVHKYPHISIQKLYFNQQLKNHIKNPSQICKIYICGPPSMNQSIGQILLEQQVDERLYHFM